MHDVAEYVPTEVLPPRWSCERVVLEGGLPAIAYSVRLGREQGLRRLLVLATLDDYGDAGLWLHTSTSKCRPTAFGETVGIPMWNELKQVHQVVHADRPVVQMLPPQEYWMNISECLHLWERLDAPTVPEAVWKNPT